MVTLCLLLISAVQQADSRPLPELKTFLAEFRKTLHPDDVLLSQYTYSAKYTHVELNSDGKPKSTEVEVYEITREARSGQVYRRLVSKNGMPVKSSKPEKTRQRRPSRQDEEKILNDVFDGYDFRIVGRENLDGRAAIRLKFTPRANYRPKTFQGKLLQNIAGEAWVNEMDHALAKIHAQMADSFSIGFGLIAKLQKGSEIEGERRKINNEIWLPARTEVTVSGRILLLKGINRREIVEYSDYKKFSVETNIKFPDLEKQ